MMFFVVGVQWEFCCWSVCHDTKKVRKHLSPWLQIAMTCVSKVRAIGKSCDQFDVDTKERNTIKNAFVLCTKEISCNKWHAWINHHNKAWSRQPLHRQVVISLTSSNVVVHAKHWRRGCAVGLARWSCNSTDMTSNPAEVNSVKALGKPFRQRCVTAGITL